MQRRVIRNTYADTYSKIHKELIQFNSKKQTKQNQSNLKKKKWKEELNRHFPKDIQMSTGTKTGAQYH